MYVVLLFANLFVSMITSSSNGVSSFWQSISSPPNQPQIDVGKRLSRQNGNREHQEFGKGAVITNDGVADIPGLDVKWAINYGDGKAMNGASTAYGLAADVGNMGQDVDGICRRHYSITDERRDFGNRRLC